METHNHTSNTFSRYKNRVKNKRFLGSRTGREGGGIRVLSPWI